MPLTLLQAGQAATVKKVTGRDEVRAFLSSLGFVEGGQVTMVNQVGGTVIVSVKEGRVALSRSMAGRITV